MSRRSCRTTRNLNEDDEDPEITSGDEAEREYEKHADEPPDPDDVILGKVAQLVDLMKTCHTKMIYTGAGISTSANIPDYRGPGGVYTLAKKGIAVSCKNIISQSPTSSHLVIKELFRHRYISHIVSQNCDGLHLRSGIPQCGLSEIHGNMHIEVCSSCPDRQFIRKFDVTEDSGYRAHTTRRNCQCGAPLRDTIVHYGERGKARYPLNWEAAQEIVPMADLIICIGSSLQVLKDYKFLWPAPGSDAKIVIINMQWTPKDADAALVIRGDCDKVLTKLAEGLDIDIRHYCRDCDPILTARRNTRNGELLMKMTDCMCHVRPPRCSVASESEVETAQRNEQYVPGWWIVGMKGIFKDIDRERRSNTKEDSGYDEQNRDPSSNNTPSPPVNSTVSKRGRPRKRKSTDEEEAIPKTRRKMSGDDDEYEPERHHRSGSLIGTLRATRSSGAADEHPLVGEFRKKRQDAGKRRGGAEAPEDLPEEDPVVPREEEPVEEEAVEEEIEEESVEDEEEEEVDVEHYEEAGERVEMMEEMQEDIDELSNGHFLEHQPRSIEDEDVFVDVVGDIEEESVYTEEVQPDSPAPMPPPIESTPIEDPMFDERAFRECTSASLSLSLSQLNAPVQHINSNPHLGDLYGFNDDQHHLMGMQPRQRYDAHTARFVTDTPYRTNRFDGAGCSHSAYYDDHDHSLSRYSSSTYESMLRPSLTSLQSHTSAFSAPTQSSQQINFVKPSQTASTSATLPAKYQRGPRKKKELNSNSVEAFLRQINSGVHPDEASTSIGAIYDAARQVMNPEDNEQKFQKTLVCAVRTKNKQNGSSQNDNMVSRIEELVKLGVDADPPPPPPPKKVTKRTPTKRTPKQKNGARHPKEPEQSPM